MTRSCSIVLVEVIDDIGRTSSHLEWASTTTKNIPFRNGPAKSKCTLDHGSAGDEAVPLVEMVWMKWSRIVADG